MSLLPRPPSSSLTPQMSSSRLRESPLIQTDSSPSSTACSSTPPVVGELRAPTPPANGRTITPSKVSRSSTPDSSLQRSGSATRSSSASRVQVPLALSGVSSSIAHKTRVNLARASFDARREQRARSVQVGSRKLWRFERDNPALRGPYGVDTMGSDSYDDFENIATSSLRADFRSSISKLFQERNFEQMVAFRSCSESKSMYTGAPKSKRRLRKDLWSSAETAWLLVEKRLRVSVQEAIKYRRKVLDFVEAFETILMHFAEKLDIPPVALLPEPLSSVLAQPLELQKNAPHQSSRAKSTNSKKKSKIKKESSVDAGTVVGDDTLEKTSNFYSIRVNVNTTTGDGALYRLFIHATSQFYGFKSSSFTDAKGERITIVTAPVNIAIKKTPTIAEEVSLSAYLGSLVNQEQVEIE